jgi:hypothetical protein
MCGSSGPARHRLRLSAARSDYQELAIGLSKDIRDGTETSGLDFPKYLQLIRASPQLTPLSVAMLPEVARHVAELEKFAQEVSISPQPISPELMDRVRAAVDGPVLGAKLVDGELWVVGGDQPNRFNMDLIAAVRRLGGADVYTYSTPPRAVSDRHRSVRRRSLRVERDFAGPAAAVFGVSIVHDRAGNDRQASAAPGSIAAALFGVAVS